MKVQLMEYGNKYDYEEIIRELDKKNLKKLEQYIKEIIPKMSYNLEYDLAYFLRQMRIKEVDKNFTEYNMKLFSNITIGYLVCKQDNIKWINCSCGAVGKFRRLKWD